MSREILCTVGTSLLTNRDDRPWSGWRPKSADPLPEAATVDAWLETADPVKATAETNTLRYLDLGAADWLVLVHSDTPEGRFCAERLADFYRPAVREVHLEQIGKLGYGAAQFTTGLKSLVDVSLRRVREARERGRRPVFCATGGFKAEIAFLNVMGALLGVEVYYIHELHRELVELPRLPLQWDAGFVVRNEEFFRWIDEELRPAREVESWLKGRPELRPLVEDVGDGMMCLTAAGDMLYRVARERLAMAPGPEWPPADSRPPAEKNLLSGEEHRRPKSWEKFVEWLCSIDCVKDVRYDASAASSERVRVVDPDRGILAVCYGSPDKLLPLRVETTARGAGQCELVANYLRRRR